MEQLFKKVEQPVDLCVGIVVVLQPNGSLGIYVNLTKLNVSVRRERHALPAVLPDAKVFTKFDGNTGF